MADWLFWVIAAVVALGSLGLVFRPLLRGPRGCRRPGAVRRAGLPRPAPRDRGGPRPWHPHRGGGRGDARRGLAPAHRRRRRGGSRGRGPRGGGGPGARRPVAPGRGDRGGGPDRGGRGPLRRRSGRRAFPTIRSVPAWPGRRTARANRPKQAEVEALVAARGPAPAVEARAEDTALVAKLEAVLKDRPDDIEGQRLLARSLGSLGRWAEARAAEEKVVALLGDGATAQDYVDLAEFSVLAAGGYVSPEAEAALGRALSLDPANPVGRYYSGLALVQGGRPDLAYRLWSALLAEGPPDAPWIARDPRRDRRGGADGRPAAAGGRRGGCARSEPRPELRPELRPQRGGDRCGRAR